MFLDSEMTENLRNLEARYQLILSQHRHGITNIAIIINQAISSVLFIIIFPIQLVTTFVLGILVSITFGIFGWILTLIWLLFLGPLLGTSWIWIKVPILRPILLLPGVLWANASDICASLFPAMGEWDARKTKIDLCNAWPLSWKLLKDG